jgi:hypothetical protein
LLSYDLAEDRINAMNAVVAMPDGAFWIGGSKDKVSILQRKTANSELMLTEVREDGFKQEFHLSEQEIPGLRVQLTSLIAASNEWQVSGLTQTNLWLLGSKGNYPLPGFGFAYLNGAYQLSLDGRGRPVIKQIRRGGSSWSNSFLLPIPTAEARRIAACWASPDGQWIAVRIAPQDSWWTKLMRAVSFAAEGTPGMFRYHFVNVSTKAKRVISVKGIGTLLLWGIDGKSAALVGDHGELKTIALPGAGIRVTNGGNSPTP